MVTSICAITCHVTPWSRGGSHHTETRGPQPELPFIASLMRSSGLSRSFISTPAEPVDSLNMALRVEPAAALVVVCHRGRPSPYWLLGLKERRGVPPFLCGCQAVECQTDANWHDKEPPLPSVFNPPVRPSVHSGLTFLKQFYYHLQAEVHLPVWCFGPSPVTDSMLTAPPRALPPRSRGSCAKFSTSEKVMEERVLLSSNPTTLSLLLLLLSLSCPWLTRGSARALWIIEPTVEPLWII